jgi:hypothetical protein
MAIGSFLASAGRIGEGIETYQTQSELRRLQRLQAELARGELARQEQFRQVQLEAPIAELPEQGLLLGAPMRVAEPEFAPAGRTAAAGLMPAAPAAMAPGTAPAAAPKPAARAPAKLNGVTIPGFDSRKPDRLNIGVAGFQKVDPKASDVEQGLTRKRNENLLDFTLSELSKGVEPWFTGLRTPFVSQEAKADLQFREKAGSWYGSEQAREYFRRNPEVLPIAQRDPVEFYRKMLESSQAGYEAARGALPAPAPATTPAGLSTSIAKIAGAETGGVANPYQTPNLAGASSAFGKYQFTKGTWVDTYRKLNPKTGLSDDRIWAQRTNPELQERLMQKLTQDNAAALTGAGLPVSDATLYLAHFLGPKGAQTLLNADANTPVEQLPGFASAIKANPTVLRGKTVGQVAEWAAGKMGGAAPAGGTGVGPQMAAAQTTPVPVRIDPSNFYLANPNATSRDVRIAMQNRQELARMADMYRRAGMGNEFTAARLKVVELDNSLMFLQGMQGLQELALANDPRRLAAVWSDYAGVPVQLQPQTDGSFNVVVNGRVTQRGVARSAIIDAARSSFDKQYVTTQAEAQAEMNTEFFKSQLRMTEEAAKTAAKFAADVQLKLLEGDNARATEMIKQMDPNGKLTMLPDGSGQAILQVQGQTLLIDKGGVQIEGAPEGMVSGPSARPISGLPQRTVGVGTGG